MMMMGVGLLVMLVFLLVLVGVPTLLIAAAVRGRLSPGSKARPETIVSGAPVATSRPDDLRKCGTCGRAVQPAWNVCPYCGASLA